jgi:hypothetical protein
MATDPIDQLSSHNILMTCADGIEVVDMEFSYNI